MHQRYGRWNNGENICMTIIDLYKVMVSSKAKARSEVVMEFLKEVCGSKDNVSRYEYNVEEFENYKIVLKRPGRFKKGFDFTVNIRGIYFKKQKRYENPSFTDIKKALSYAKENYASSYDKVKKEINNIFEVKSYDLENVKEIYFIDYEMKLHPIAIILLAIKWLFVSEDISYWNWSGRNMFMDDLKKLLLA